MRIEVNIDDFLRRFKKNYEFLYNAKGYVAGYDEALEYGNRFIEKYPATVREFNLYREDILSSDREVVAFAFTLEDMGIIREDI